MVRLANCPCSVHLGLVASMFERMAGQQLARHTSCSRWVMLIQPPRMFSNLALIEDKGLIDIRSALLPSIISSL